MNSLPDEINDQIQLLCEEGNQFAEQERYADALNSFWRAFDLLPVPTEQWEAATWILTAIGDVNYLAGDFEAGLQNLAAAMRCPNALGNPFINLRLGQCQFEIGSLDRAADEFTRAYMGAGIKIFESDNAKYLAFLKTRLKRPPKGW